VLAAGWLGKALPCGEERGRNEKIHEGYSWRRIREKTKKENRGVRHLSRKIDVSIY
jgi:hypothetical protein